MMLEMNKLQTRWSQRRWWKLRWAPFLFQSRATRRMLSPPLLKRIWRKERDGNGCYRYNLRLHAMRLTYITLICGGLYWASLKLRILNWKVMQRKLQSELNYSRINSLEREEIFMNKTRLHYICLRYKFKRLQLKLSKSPKKKKTTDMCGSHSIQIDIDNAFGTVCDHSMVRPTLSLGFQKATENE